MEDGEVGIRPTGPGPSLPEGSSLLYGIKPVPHSHNKWIKLESESARTDIRAAKKINPVSTTPQQRGKLLHTGPTGLRLRSPPPPAPVLWRTAHQTPAPTNAAGTAASREQHGAVVAVMQRAVPETTAAAAAAAVPAAPDHPSPAATACWSCQEPLRIGRRALLVLPAALSHRTRSSGCKNEQRVDRAVCVSGVSFSR